MLPGLASQSEQSSLGIVTRQRQGNSYTCVPLRALLYADNAGRRTPLLRQIGSHVLIGRRTHVCSEALHHTGWPACKQWLVTMVLVQHHRPGYGKGSERLSSKRSKDMVAQKTLLTLLGLLALVLVHRHFVLKITALVPHEGRRTFRPGDIWLDNNGSPIQAHGGGILYYNGTYYWYGEDKSGRTYIPEAELGMYSPPRVDLVGVRCYSSVDLYNWRDEGLVLRAGHHPDLQASRVLERPKVLRNDLDGSFVMWMHIDDAHYDEAKAGVARSRSPTGPFEYLGSFRPNRQMSRDMTVFKDDDGRAYLFYSSEENQVMHVAQLARDYLSVLPPYDRVLVGLSREAPAVFKHQDVYLLLTSACTGWLPNAAEVFAARSPKGPWQSLGNPCQDADATACNTTFGAQDTYVFPVHGRDGRGNFIMMADRWNPQDLGSSRYVWLPLRVEVHGDMRRVSWAQHGLEWRRQRPHSSRQLASRQSGVSVTFRWFDEWDLGVFDRPDLWAQDPLMMPS